jgi:hypothetical protein
MPLEGELHAFLEYEWSLGEQTRIFTIVFEPLCSINGTGGGKRMEELPRLLSTGKF